MMIKNVVAFFYRPSRGEAADRRKICGNSYLWSSFSITAVLLAWFLFQATTGYAQTPLPAETPVPPAEPETGVIELTFAQLEQPTFDLTQPAAEEFSFSLPYRWLVNGSNSYLDLYFDVYQSTPTLPATPETGAASLTDIAFTVFLDDIPLASFIPQAGINQTLRLPLPVGAFANPDKTNHKIRFALQGNDCLNNAPMRLVVYDSSTVRLAYDTRPVTPNLADFPRPLVQESLTPESVLLLVPDAYTDADLAAAASVAAALGQTAGNNVTLSLTTPAAVTPTQLTGQSVIAIGSPADNSFIADLYQRQLLPTTLDADGRLLDTAGRPIPTTTGILQEIPSGAAADYVYLIVTGGSDAAVERAARALSANGPEFGRRGNLALIEAVQSAESAESAAGPIIPEQFTLADIGFRDITWSGLGRYKSSGSFTIPASWNIQDEAALTFSYLASSALDTGQSSLRVELNGKVIGQAPLSAAQTGEQQVTIPLPPADLRPGESNRLTFVAELFLAQPCPPPDAPQAWLRLRNNGIISLPYEEMLGDLAETAVTAPLLTNPDLSDVLFALPASPSETDLDSLAQLAQMLGDAAAGGRFQPLVQRAPITDTTTLAPYQVIALGRPSTNDLIASVNDQLPQPFLPETDNLGETVGDLQYRLPPDFSLGVIQHLPAPWNPARPFVVISGTTDEGLRWAVNTLSGDLLGGQLDGNVIFIQDTFAESFDVSAAESFLELAAISTAVPDSVAAATAIVTPTAASTFTPSAAITPTAVSQLPGKYQPADSASSTMTMLVAALIGGGLLLLAGGAVYTWRESRRRDDAV